MKITLLVITIISTLFTLPALAQTTTNSFKVESNFARPDDSSNIKITDTLTYRLDESTKQTLSVGIQKYSEENKDPIHVYPIKVDTEWNLDSKAKRSATLNLGVGYNFVEGQEGKVSGNVRYSEPLGNTSRVGLSYNFLPMFDSQTTIKNGLTRSDISSSVNWDIDKFNKASVRYSLGLLSDGNTSHEANARYERTLSPGLYVAAVGSYRDTYNTGKGYWTPSNRIAVGPEVGVTFPVGSTLACRVVGKATLVSENDRKSDESNRDSSIGAGGGCRFNLNKTNSLEVRVGGGYGASVSAEYTSRF